MINKNSLKSLSAHHKILIREESYAYLLPCVELSHLISNFTITFPDKTTISDDYTIMPHGSGTLVFFQYNDKLHSFLFGPTTKPVKVGDLANQCSIIFIIEYQPAGFFPFANTNQKELTDRIIPFSMINDSLDSAMRAILETACSADELIMNFEAVLLQNIQFPYPEELALALQLIIQSSGISSAAAIAAHVSYSPRHLNRLFNLYLGMSIKGFSRLVRINKSIQLLNENRSISEICEILSYYDSSHFVKDFKIVCQLTPQEYRAHMSDFYSEIAKF
ncbi:AraC family transcriptional regulator [Dielma fastidiosa]|uniref:AraC family transcriptional regulator n=1 Tax=Dielma fastidiosa TaxID=1034346 RepID=UPI003565CDDF